MSWISLFALIVALFLFAQSLLSLFLKVYSWEHPERLFSSQAPASYLSARLSFSVLLPARHEEAVIYETIQRVWRANYPAQMLEIIVICSIDDRGTIAEAYRAMRDLGSERIRVATFSNLPVNKAHALNVGFQQTRNQIISIFDAEDDIDPNIFNMVNTVMLKERVGIVQAGVQLMNFQDHWFGMHNCLEYFFWFKSRLHFHSRVGLIPLGGNAVFLRRELVERVGGWDEQCLMEDADIGLRLSVLGEPIRVVYDARHVTREETPESVSAFIRQRNRWQQGFLQLLWKGSWQSLPRLSQRLLALYTLSYPYVLALIAPLWSFTIAAIFFLKAPALATMVFFLPLYGLLFQFATSVAGAFFFAREYKLRFSVLNLIGMAITFLPYQWLLSISAIRTVFLKTGRVRW